MKYSVLISIALLSVFTLLIAEPASNVTPSSEFEIQLTKARNGDAEAQYQVAIAYEEGEGVALNDSLCTYWYIKSATNGLDVAQVNLGYRYSKGLGIPRSDSLSFYWIKKAAEQNNSDGMLDLGVCYEKGIGTEKNFKEAAKWYKNAAEKDNPAAMANLADLYVLGAGVSVDHKEAYFWSSLSNSLENSDKANDIMSSTEEKLSKKEIASVKERIIKWKKEHNN